MTTGFEIYTNEEAAGRADESPKSLQSSSAHPPEEGVKPPRLASVAAQRVDPLALARAEKLKAVAERSSTCTRCGLSESRRNVVFGSGNANADLMFVGEGPGEHEDRQGLPFVGRAGELLNKIIQAIGMSRDEVYIANIVKCRPPRNRNPENEEVTACFPFLERQIQLVHPRIIVALGRVAGQSLLGMSSSLGAMRGRWHEVQGVPTRVTYHPAALLRQASYKRPTWEDMQIVRDRLAEGE